MGDRSNIAVKQYDGSTVYLYGHWMGEDSIKIAKTVLGREQRWSDHAYLARMIFSEMVKGDLDSDTGYGISTTMCDNEYPIIVLDPSTQTAWLEEYEWDNGGSFKEITPRIPFGAFVNSASVSETFNDLKVYMGARIPA